MGRLDVAEAAHEDAEVLEYEYRLRFRYLLGLGIASLLIGAVSWVFNPCFGFSAASLSMAAGSVGPLARDSELRAGLGGRSAALIIVAALALLVALGGLALRVLIAWSDADL